MSEGTFTELDHVTELYAISEKENRQLKTKLHRLEREMAGVHEDSPEAKEVKALLDLWWVKVKGSHPNVAHGLESTRAAKVRAALKRRKKIDGAEFGMLMCRKAIIGITCDDWAMGRVPKSRGKSYDDIAEHILNTDGDIERWAKMFDDWCSALTMEPLPLEKVQSLQASRVRRDRTAQRSQQRYEQVQGDPSEAVLSALSLNGCEWRCKPRDGWEAQCPAHKGTDMKLSIDWNTGGDKLLLTCWSHGCEAAEVMAALDLPLFVLFRDSQRKAA